MPDSSAPTLPAKGSRNLLLRIAAGAIALDLFGLALWCGWGGVAWAAVILGVTLIAFMATEQRRWTTAGFIYAAAALIASAMVRLDGGMGFYALMFTLFVVWASDIGGYFAGRAIGGPKLWPRVSPNNTWAGSGCALVLSALVALIVSWLG